MSEIRYPRATRIDAAEARLLEVEPWDKVVPLRANDLDSGSDPSFEKVILPTFRTLLARRDITSLLDVGCGAGRLTRRLSDLSRGSIVAIDPSQVSAQIAQEHLGSDDRCLVHNMSIQRYAASGFGGHDACVVSMVMQDVVDLASFLESCSEVIGPRGSLYCCVAHPCFWPAYWHYDSQPWFSYDREIFIRSEFRTSLSNSGIDTLHVHRPMHRYVNELLGHGFRVKSLLEPMMSAEDQRNNGVTWRTPHFLFIECVRRG